MLLLRANLGFCAAAARLSGLLAPTRGVWLQAHPGESDAELSRRASRPWSRWPCASALTPFATQSCGRWSRADSRGAGGRVGPGRTDGRAVSCDGRAPAAIVVDTTAPESHVAQTAAHAPIPEAVGDSDPIPAPAVPAAAPVASIAAAGGAAKRKAKKPPLEQPGESARPSGPRDASAAEESTAGAPDDTASVQPQEERVTHAATAQPAEPGSTDQDASPEVGDGRGHALGRRYPSAGGRGSDRSGCGMAADRRDRATAAAHRSTA